MNLGIIALPLYAIIFSCHDDIGTMDKGKSSGDWSISHTGTSFPFSVQGMSFIASFVKKRLFFKRPICILRFHKVLFEPISLFRTHSNKLHGCQNPRILSFQNVKSFQPPIMIKKIALPTTKVEVNEPDYIFVNEPGYL